MRWNSLGGAASAAALLSSHCADAAGFPRSKAGNGYLAVSVGTINRAPKSLKRDDGSIVTTLLNEDFFYATEISIGTPPQNVTVLVDTGSNELWVNPDCENVSTQDQYNQCQSFGEYDPSKSTTPPVGPYGREQIRYGDASDSSTQTSATIRYYRDTITFGGTAELKNQTFGVVIESDGISQGILGLAPDLDAGYSSDLPYPLVLSSMAEEGLIASRVFALDLRHAADATGAVIYGGLDRNKFIGSLETRDIVKGSDGSFRLATELTSVGITTTSAKTFSLDSSDTNVMLDSGTTITRMHSSAAYPILEAMNAQSDGEGYYYTECSWKDKSGGVDFTFGSKTVQVPFADFLLDVGSDTYCYIGLVTTTDQQILGDTVLRAGYFVFDWDNEQVHIAQAANCGDDDIVAVSSGTDAVPDVTGNCAPSDATETGGALASETGAGAISIPTQAYTTTYTVTSCDLFATDCKTGVVTTQTIEPASGTVTVTAGASTSTGDSDDDSAAVQPQAMSWLLVVAGAFVAGINLV